jgi:hypothetical protein
MQQLFLSLEFGTLVFVPPVLFWLVLGFCSYIVIGNDVIASIIGVKSKMLKEPKMIAILRANEFNCKVRGVIVKQVRSHTFIK